MTIAVEIADTSNAPIVRRFNWLPSAIRTALFGSSELNLRVSGEAEQLVLESSLKLLEFDLTLDQARQEVRDGEAAAAVRNGGNAITPILVIVGALGGQLLSPTVTNGCGLIPDLKERRLCGCSQSATI